MPKSKRRSNLQWKRVVPGIQRNVAPNTLSSAALVLPTNLESDDDYTFVKGFFRCRISADNIAVASLHSVIGAMGIIKRPITVDSAQYDPINEDGPWMYWQPFIISNFGATHSSSFVEWMFEINAGRRMERFDGITAFAKSVTFAGADSFTWSIGGSLLFYKA